MESRIKCGTGCENLSSRREEKSPSNGDCKGEITDAWHGGETSRSSEEVAVTAVERRGSIVGLCRGEKLTSSGGIETDKTKPFSKSRQSVYAVVTPGLWLFPEIPPIDEDGVADFTSMHIKGYIKLLANRKFDASKQYLFPIPTKEILINSNLSQNPNY